MKIFIYSGAIIGAYMVGAVPSGFLVAHAGGIKDITKHGSGNIGATNVARSLGMFSFFVVFFLDFFKAFFYVKFLVWCGLPNIVSIGAASVLLVGNGYSLFLKGYGGKGVATSLGILAAYAPIIIPYLLMLWGLVFLATQTVGIASCAALLSLPIIAFFLKRTDMSLLALTIFISLWGLFRHRDNILNYFKKTIR